MVRTDGGTAPRRSSSAIAEGTVLTSVTAAPGGGEASARASSPRITVPPQQRGTNSSNTERSKQIEVAAKTPARSATENVRRAQATRAAALRCSIATPLGRPVEPEV